MKILKAVRIKIPKNFSMSKLARSSSFGPRIIDLKQYTFACCGELVGHPSLGIVKIFTQVQRWKETVRSRFSWFNLSLFWPTLFYGHHRCLRCSTIRLFWDSDANFNHTPYKVETDPWSYKYNRRGSSIFDKSLRGVQCNNLLLECKNNSFSKRSLKWPIPQAAPPGLQF